MCIIVDAVKRQPSDIPKEEQISNAMGEVGPSITLSSFSEVLAFAAGSFVSMPVCRVFSMIAALAVLLDFLLQITAFVALVTLDFERAKDSRVDCFPCIKLNRHSMEQTKGTRQETDGLPTRYMKEVHAPFVGLWVVKILVIAIFGAFTLASIALCTRIEPGLEQQIALPRDSCLQVISKASSVPKSSYIAKPVASWLDDFLVWISPEAFSCCRKFTNDSYCPPDDQPPCCFPDEGPCEFGGVCKDCTTCFRHSDLVNDRPSTTQFKEKLPWFLNALPSADCAKGGHGAYTNSVDLNGYKGHWARDCLGITSGAAPSHGNINVVQERYGIAQNQQCGRISSVLKYAIERCSRHQFCNIFISKQASLNQRTSIHGLDNIALTFKFVLGAMLARSYHDLQPIQNDISMNNSDDETQDLNDKSSPQKKQSSITMTNKRSFKYIEPAEKTGR
ncbi:hypothetical protein KIW84_051000 [Lathyrus oleraceus]|uniref:SSD domain-containing protein n=1 Tax=Pisum sativum TaxID=3888 RepID=A0A9D4WND3_PEA|nr:hypothetical protein KIW84_051000 [Pisum sativum]